MKIDVIKEKENPLLHRKELMLSVKDFQATPKKEDVQKEVAAQFGANTVLGRFQGTFGGRELKCEAKIYESETFQNKYEPKKKERGEKKEAVKKEEKPAEAKGEKVT